MKALLRKLLVGAFAMNIAVALVPSFLFGQTYTDLHDFDCAVEGCNPTSSGILAQGRDGNLYGTLRGGKYNIGTVFKITPSGTITTIYNFDGTHGSKPFSGLTLGTDANFYGTTNEGGANSFGTIFKITPAGLITLHDFTGSDGAYPYGPPVQGKGSTFYGVTSTGTAYSITSSGGFKLLSTSIPGLSFAPLLFASDGHFYGTTPEGGAFARGTVFRMSATGAVKIIYSFDGTHGSSPYGPVVQGSDGFLYGTTVAGGSSQGGVVFRLSTGGAITLLHQFDVFSMTDGYEPIPGLVAATDGNFYGATSTSADQLAPYGTLFKVSKNGTYSELYAFDQTHGAVQQATGRQHTNGILYGLATQGGTNGGGVYYSLDVGLKPFVSLMTTSGTPSQTIEILGTGLTGATGVNFGSGSASFSVVSDSYMTAVVPATGTTGFVTVTTPSGILTSSKQFKVIPVISSFAPTSGPVGTQVTITGAGFTGATKVTFGGVKATAFTVNSATQVTATVPVGAKTGKIAVTTPGGTASKGTFTVS